MCCEYVLRSLAGLLKTSIRPEKAQIFIYLKVIYLKVDINMRRVTYKL